MPTELIDLPQQGVGAQDMGDCSQASTAATHEPSPSVPLVSALAGECQTIADDYTFDGNDTCWQCGGEGFVASCFTEYACVWPEEGCDECTRRCDVCNPAKPNPALRQVLADALGKLEGN